VTRHTTGAPGNQGDAHKAASKRQTSQLWETTIVVSFEADNLADADGIAQRLAGRVFEHPSVWSMDVEFDPSQVTETVDV
jgi:hypothetical protein